MSQNEKNPEEAGSKPPLTQDQIDKRKAYAEKRKTWTAGRKKSKLSAEEREWCDFMLDNNVGAIIAARKVFSARCIPGSYENRKYIKLRQSDRVREYMANRHERIMKEVDTNSLMSSILKPDDFTSDSLYKHCYRQLEHIRDNTDNPPTHRYKAIQHLEKLYDPSGDVNLIMRWMELLWRGALAHCPCCHSTFPLAEIKNSKFEEWRTDLSSEVVEPKVDTFERKMEIFKRAETRKRPHKSQVIALAAQERDIVGTGAARGGKSFLLATLATLAFLTPGTESWILARIYGDAKYEISYITGFLEALFYPYSNKLVTITEDKSGEYVYTSRWGSVLRIKSAQAKGSISGAELEFAGIAEPGWVDDSILGQLKARMTSRLGRIVMLGTPQGFGGILGRMTYAVGKDAKGQVIRLKPEQRLISAGCPWNYSMLQYQMLPEDNPEYVQSEREAARFMLTDAEYDTEFAGLMVSTDGSKFPNIVPAHLTRVDSSIYGKCKFVLGVDQGPKNFAAVLAGFDGKHIIVARDYFEKDDKTMKYHMNALRMFVPQWIQRLAGGFGPWGLTIFDVDPSVIPELEEFTAEGKPWPTDITWRPKGPSVVSWRTETYEFINNLAHNGNLIFDEAHCQVLHDQMMRAQNKVEENAKNKDANPDKKKGWIISDPYRGDHVCDALMLAIWTVISKQISVPRIEGAIVGDVWSEARAAQDFQRLVREREELSGKRISTREEGDMYEQQFGRRPPRRRFRPLYDDY